MLQSVASGNPFTDDFVRQLLAVEWLTAKPADALKLRWGSVKDSRLAVFHINFVGGWWGWHDNFPYVVWLGVVQGYMGLEISQAIP